MFSLLCEFLAMYAQRLCTELLQRVIQDPLLIESNERIEICARAFAAEHVFLPTDRAAFFIFRHGLDLYCPQRSVLQLHPYVIGVTVRVNCVVTQ